MSKDPRSPTADAADDPGARLDRFLAERVAVITESLPPAGVPLSGALADEIRTLEGLSQLRRTHLRRDAPRRTSRPLIAVLALTATLMTGLVFFRYQPIRTEMDIVCSAVTMTTASALQLTGLTSLTILQGIEFAPTLFEDSMELRPMLDLRPRANGSLTLSSITIPPGSDVSIQKLADAGTWRLGIKSAEAIVSLTLANGVDVSMPGQRIEAEFGRGRPLTLKAAADSGRLEVDITPTDPASFLMRHNVPVTRVAFEEALDEAAPENVGVTRGRTSSVISGTIFNQSLGDRKYTLRPRETVEALVERGQVHEVRLESDGLHLNLSASVRHLQVGVPGALQTLNPSYLEWLAEHHALKLAWGSAAWLFALMAGGIKWWQTE